MIRFLIEVFYVFLENIILFHVVLLKLLFQVKNWRIGGFCCRLDKGSFIYDIRREGEGGSHDFRQFCEWLWMVLGEGGLTLLEIHICI